MHNRFIQPFRLNGMLTTGIPWPCACAHEPAAALLHLSGGEVCNLAAENAIHQRPAPVIRTYFQEATVYIGTPQTGKPDIGFKKGEKRLRINSSKHHEISQVLNPGSQLSDPEVQSIISFH